jgi:hypothetical protein
VEHVVEMMSKPVQMILATVMIALGHAVETTEPTITLNYELNGAPHSVTILARAPAFGPDLPSGRPDPNGKICAILNFHLFVAALNGRIYAVTPTEACSKIQSPPTGESWIALIKRGNCQFVDKVRSAQAANASLTIIYDVGELLVMLNPELGFGD